MQTFAHFIYLIYLKNKYNIKKLFLNLQSISAMLLSKNVTIIEKKYLI